MNFKDETWIKEMSRFDWAAFGYTSQVLRGMHSPPLLLRVIERKSWRSIREWEKQGQRLKGSVRPGFESYLLAV